MHNLPALALPLGYCLCFPSSKTCCSCTWCNPIAPHPRLHGVHMHDTHSHADVCPACVYIICLQYHRCNIHSAHESCHSQGSSRFPVDFLQRGPDQKPKTCLLILPRAYNNPVPTCRPWLRLRTLVGLTGTSRSSMCPGLGNAAPVAWSAMPGSSPSGSSVDGVSSSLLSTSMETT